MLLDLGVKHALKYWVTNGLDPGSFGMACLYQDYDDAYSKAHYNLRINRDNSEDVIQNMIDFVRISLPIECYGSEEKIMYWLNHKGLGGHVAPEIKEKYRELEIENILRNDKKLWWNEIGA